MNKRKALEAAQKYFQKGQYDRALKEYLKHLESEPDDANARLKLAELYRKLKDPGAAIDAYNQVAQQFSRSGFDAKAAAIYRQILKVDPTSLDARTKLGEHCQRMGLTSEALRELQEAIRLCQERGLKREAFDLLKRVADLDPSNIPNRLSLADLLAREGLAAEAQEEFGKLLDQAEGEGALDVVGRVAQQMLGCFPDSERALQSYARALVKAGQVQEAITRILQALPKFPNSITVREELVAAYQARGDQASAQTTYREIAEIYKRRGSDEEARDILQRFVPVEGLGSEELDSSPSIVLGQANASALSDWADESAFEPPPSRPLSASAAAKATGPVDASSRRVDELLAEARVARDFGDADAARTCAQRVIALDPENRAAKEILNWVRGESAPDAEAGAAELDDEDLQLVLDQAADRPGARASSEDDAGTLPDIELVLVDEDNAGAAEYASVAPPGEVERLRAQRAAAPAAAKGGEEFEIDLDDLDLAEESLESSAPPEDGRDEVLPADESVHAAQPAGADAGSTRGAAAAEAGARPASRPDSSASAARSGTTWAQQSSWIGKTIDAADAIFMQGLHAQAAVLYKQVLAHAPSHPQALLRLGEIAAKYGKDPAGDGGEFDLSALEDTSVESAAAGGRKAAAKSDEPDEFLEFSQIGLAALEEPPIAPVAAKQEVAKPEAESSFEFEVDLEEAPAPVVPPPAARPIAVRPEPPKRAPAEARRSEPRLVVSPPAPPVPPAPAEPAVQVGALLDAEDLEAALEGIGVRASPEGAAEDGFDLAAALNDGGSGATAPSAPRLQDVFRAFKKGIEDQIGEEEWSAHYDLAIAYREMGLLEDAVEQLAIVARGRGLGLEGVALLATCKIELGAPEDAIKLLSSALERDQDPEARTALHYDLAEAYLAAGSRERALEAFRTVLAEQPQYREVQKRVSELS